MLTYRCYYLDDESLGESRNFSALNDDDAEQAARRLVKAAGGQQSRYEVWRGTRLVCSTWPRVGSSSART